jgi:hypothetical protein
MIKRLASKRSNGFYNVWELIPAKELEGGNPVDAVRVVFLNKEKTQREKRSLLEIGALVRYYNRVGETEQITQ